MKLAQKLGLAYYRANLQLLSLVSPKKAARKAFKLFSTPFIRAKDKPDPIFAEGELLSFRLDDNLITGHRWNHPAKKKVMIVHGFESSSVKFHQHINALIKADLEVLAFDAPAHGFSGGKRILLPDYIKAIEAVIERFGPVDCYIAHSFGGLALMMTLERVPHKETDKIVLIAPATETTTAVDRFFRIFGLSDTVRAHFEELVLKKGGAPSTHFSIRRAMKNTNASVLWIHDDTDKVTPLSDALQVKEDLHTHVKFITTTGLGHRRIYKDEKVIQTVVDFLKE
jgi:pimeloyl-ACP methyl ester carboxylesterase